MQTVNDNIHQIRYKSPPTTHLHRGIVLLVNEPLRELADGVYLVVVGLARGEGGLVPLD